MRRDMINGEIANLRDLLPLPSSTRQRLSQLQLMALVCVYVRKSNYFNEGIYSFKDFYFKHFILYLMGDVNNFMSTMSMLFKSTTEYFSIL